MTLRRTVLLVAAVVAAGLLPVGTAEAAQGPPPTVPTAELAASLTCTPDVDRATRDPVLLFPAFSTAQESFGASYLRDLPHRGFPTCAVSLPDKGYADLQRAAQFAAYAIRTVGERSGRQVAVLGHQHGGTDWLLALRFWPDLPARVSDYISLATPHHGTATARTACDLLRRCAPSVWQIAAGSQLIGALTREPPPPGPSYTSISTDLDEVITPQPAASRMTGARNVVLQDVCPARPVEHFTILVDPLTERLVLDALDHPGPADPGRLTDPCGTPLAGPSAIGGLAGLASFAGGFTTNAVLGAVPAEPVLRPEFASG